VSYLNKEIVGNIELDLPVETCGTININIQNKIVEQYEKIEEYRDFLQAKIVKINEILSKINMHI